MSFLATESLLPELSARRLLQAYHSWRLRRRARNRRARPKLDDLSYWRTLAAQQFGELRRTGRRFGPILASRSRISWERAPFSSRRLSAMIGREFQPATRRTSDTSIRQPGPPSLHFGQRLARCSFVTALREVAALICALRARFQTVIRLPASNPSCAGAARQRICTTNFAATSSIAGHMRRAVAPERNEPPDSCGDRSIHARSMPVARALRAHHTLAHPIRDRGEILDRSYVIFENSPG